jgi:uncharacterized protein (TIGR02270 family)
MGHGRGREDQLTVQMTTGAPIMWEVVKAHLDVAQLAWFQWSRAVVAPNYTLAEVAHGPEERLLAQLMGLAAAGEDCVERLLVPALEYDTDFIAAASLALLAAPGGVKVLLPALRAASVEERAVMARALGLARGRGLEDQLESLLGNDDPAVRAAALDALAIRGRTPVELRGLLANRAPEVQAAALRAARHAGLAHRGAIEAALQSPALEVRDAALEVGLSLGFRAAWLAARKLAESRQPGCEVALSLLALSGEPGDLQRIEAALAVRALRGAAIWALGFSGWPRAVELCLPCLADRRHARVAGEVISAITGLVIERQFVREEEPPPEEPIPFEEEDLDADLVPRAEAALPLPQLKEVEYWWQRERRRFQPTVRYLGGEPVGPKVLMGALANGPMRRKPLIALEMAARSHGAFWLETRTWAREQLAAISERRLEAPSGFNAGFERLLRG